MGERTIPVTSGSPRHRTFETRGFEVVDAWFPPHLRLAPHVHERASFAVMLEGSFDVIFSTRTHGCAAGTVATEPIAERHGNRVDGAGAHVLVVQPDPARDDLRACAPLLDGIHRFRHDGIARTAWRVCEEIRRSDAVTPLAVEGLVLEMLSTAARLGEADRTGRAPAWLARVREIVHDRYLDHLRTADIAREVGVHPVHVARVFRAHHRTTLGSYVRALRLEWACRQLRETPEPISSLAVAAGFADQSHFTRAFRRHTGHTPARYRRMGAGPDLPTDG